MPKDADSKSEGGFGATFPFNGDVFPRADYLL